MKDSVEKYFDLTRYRRVIRLAKTPDRQDFLDVAKIAGAGIGLLGFAGFMIALLMGFLPLT